MATKLRLRFQGQRSALLLKAFIFFIGLWFASAGEARLIPLLFFLGAAFWVYLTPFENVAPYRAGFLTLLVLTSIAVLGFSIGAWFVIPAAGVAYAILGLKGRYFVYRSRVHYVTTLALTYGIFSFIFISDRSTWFMPKLVLMGLGLFFIWKEFFAAEIENAGGEARYRGGLRSPRYETVLGALLTLTSVQSVWAISLLPLGSVSAANLSFLVTLVLGDIFERKIEGTLSRKAMLTGATVAVFGTIFILGTSTW